MGEGFLGSPPTSEPTDSQEGRGRTVICSVPTGADCFTRGHCVQYCVLNSSEPRRRASGRRDLLPWGWIFSFLFGVADPGGVPRFQGLVLPKVSPSPWWLRRGMQWGGSCADSRSAAARDSEPVVLGAGGGARGVVEPPP